VRALGLDRRPLLDPRHQPKWRPVPLHAWGANERGQLGVAAVGGSSSSSSSSSSSKAPDELETPTRTAIEVDARKGWAGTVRQLAAGGAHSALVTDDGHLYLWGGNEAGQLGSGGSPGRVLVEGPDQVHPFPRRAAMVALGHAHTLVLEQGTGRVFGVGANGAGEATGQAGDSNNCREEGGGLVRLLLSQKGAEEVRMRWIAAGVRHSAGVTAEGGALVTWGGRTHGEGLPAGISSWRPADGAEVVRVACGWRHTVVLDSRGRVFALGANKYGQRGLGGEGKGEAEAVRDPLPQRVPLGDDDEVVTDVACGWSHTLALTAGGHVWGWGRNTFGQLGLGSGGPASAPAPVRLPLPEGAVPVRQIAVGSEFSVVVGADGGVYACGWNEHGNLGVGDRENRPAWVRVPVPASVEALAKQDGARGQLQQLLLLACGGAHVLALARDQRQDDGVCV
jgi:alpha-tubulin suppressor-like RCC1 family protein